MSRRRNAMAGLFYPNDPVTLKNQIISFLSQSKRTSTQPVRFLIVPHAGYRYSGTTAGAGYAEIITDRIQRVILLGPSHRHYFQGLAATTDTQWETPLGSVELESIDHPRLLKNAMVHRDEHCLEVQIPFLQFLLPNARIIPLLLGGPRAQAGSLAEILSPFDSQDTLWVISSDFNHTGPNFQYEPKAYGYRSGEELDRKAIAYITAGDIDGFQVFLEKTEATICGALPILVAMHLIRKRGQGQFVFKAYDCSGKQTQDLNSVGYAALYR